MVRSGVPVTAIIVCAAAFAVSADAAVHRAGDIASPNAASELASIDETPAQLLAGSGGVTLAELQQQLDALHNGQRIPHFGTPPVPHGSETIIAGTPTQAQAAIKTAPARQRRSGHHNGGRRSSPAASAATTYICLAFGSNVYTGNSYTASLTGWATLGFLQQCTNPHNTISSSCTITATVRPPKHTNTGRNNDGGVRCSTDTVVGQNARGTKGAVTANWGAFNEVGVPFVGLRGCIVDGTSAFCAYKTTFRVGRKSRWGWGAG
jgi:hypothetical protein